MLILTEVYSPCIHLVPFLSSPLPPHLLNPIRCCPNHEVTGFGECITTTTNTYSSVKLPHISNECWHFAGRNDSEYTTPGDEYDGSQKLKLCEFTGEKPSCRVYHQQKR